MKGIINTRGFYLIFEPLESTNIGPLRMKHNVLKCSSLESIRKLKKSLFLSVLMSVYELFGENGNNE